MRKEASAVVIGAVLVATAFVVPHLHLETVTPLLNADADRFRDFAATSPVFGWWNTHVGPGTVPAVLIAVAAVLWGPTLARRLPWRWLPWAAWAVSCAWAFSLAMIDGWQRGFAGRLTAKHEYLREVPTVTDIPEMLRTFASRILDFQPDSWITHVSGHPPGALMTYVWLDRIGLSGGAWAGLLSLLAGSSIAAAIVVTVRALADEDAARRVAVFAAVAPTAIWIAVSADGYFAGVAAWGITLLALAVTGRARLPIVAAVGAGLLLGWGIFLNYGMGLMALPAVAVLIGATSWRAALKAFLPAAVAALAVAAVFYAAGFWWLDGYHLVQERYWQGIALERPFAYWGWANFASTVCAIGLGSVAAVGRAFDFAALKRRSGLHLLVFGALLSIVSADLSQLSKAETERIWLPFTVWLVAATALLPWRSLRWWLALNVIGALAVNHFILTNW